jgi:hypothetical protein
MPLSITLLRSKPSRGSPAKPLAKVWRADGEITPIANVTWFEAREITCHSLADFDTMLTAVEKLPRIALVKETIAPGADPKRLRRRCVAGKDNYTGEEYPAGLVVTPKRWLVVDIDHVARPATIDWRDGAALAAHARSLLPSEFAQVSCIWQLSGSAGHPSRRDEARLHLIFMLNTAVIPAAWKTHFHSPQVDASLFDQSKLIFTAAPIICGRSDPIAQRHGLLDGEPLVMVPENVKHQSAALARDEANGSPPAPPIAPGPMPRAASAFVEIIARANVLRSQHEVYTALQGGRSRRLAFALMVRQAFGLTDPAALSEAFHHACVGDDDPHGDHDAQQAVEWALRADFNGRRYSTRRLLCDASAALHKAGDHSTATRAARLAMHFWKIETGAGDREKGDLND